MNKEKTERIREVATRAMLNSIEFASQNFAVESQRDLIMQNVCESAVSPAHEIKTVALQCLSKIISLYYQFMERYMSQALFSITFEAMKSDDDAVILQGIEFWSTLAEVEQELIECFNIDENIGITCMNYCQKALPYIVPCLINRMCVDEENDEDTWSPHKAAGVCLMLLARVCADEMSSHLLPFIASNYNSTDHMRRDATMLALGALLDSVSKDELGSVTINAHAMLLQMCKDTTPRVRDSAFWALGKIYDRNKEFSLDLEKTLSTITLIFDSINDEPRVATNVCWALNYVIHSMFDPLFEITNRRPDSLLISRYYDHLFNATYHTIKRYYLIDVDRIPTNLRYARQLLSF
ncbi:Importin subunit beta [Thelohanellus kitauei]|uniref:Importin subunit beta n=1 Tax=Thelohanellus kitauei TaxID=669202 RepID=A0A0C2J0D9_THEKT|nr:Importin subunit beta [Thelohanellus kitauei]